MPELLDVPELLDMGEVRRRTHRSVFIRDVDRVTVVLGSTQRAPRRDRSAAGSPEVALARRRSGGAAVLLEPGRSVWVDAWIPRGDPLWDDDIARSRLWIGWWWAEALGGPVTVHDGPAVCSRWSADVCFAGTAAGEVSLDDRKLVGVAQWRGREGALTHSIAYLGADWTLLASVLGLPAVAAAEITAATATVLELDPSLDRGAVIDRLLTRLPAGPAWEVA